VKLGADLARPSRFRRGRSFSAARFQPAPLAHDSAASLISLSSDLVPRQVFPSRCGFWARAPVLGCGAQTRRDIFPATQFLAAIFGASARPVLEVSAQI
jgi:hypothetical protein